ncbi:hypothetical protein [Aeromicrobium sp. 179-A 4D2 NHS]|uniref:hypothetical protein n=1 Tax=Aeromicrobium sp. 179-A 4D2 NHS TaxID=3142375 RepID=UPI00399FFED4
MALMFFNTALWTFYNGAIHNWWGLVPNAFLIPGLSLIIIVLWRARRAGLLPLNPAFVATETS